MANPSLLKLKDYDAGGDPAFSKQVEEANKQKEKQQAKKLRLKESDTRMDSLEAMPNKINSLLKQQEEYKDSKEMLDAVNAIRNKKVLGGVISKVIKAVKSSAKGEEAYSGESGSLRDLKDFEEILTNPNEDAVSFKQKQLDEIRKETGDDDAYMDFLSEFVGVREQDDRIIQQAKELGYSRSKTKNILQGKKSDIEKLNKAYDDLEEKRIGEAETSAFRDSKAEGGSMLVPPEMGMEPEMPVDTFTPEEQVMAEESQVPDNQMENDYMGFILDESLDPTEQEYLMNALEADSQLSDIFDKVVTTASEFSGAGEVKGPGDGVSDSIPARLSDGEFVITEEATSEIGADNLQTMMDDAERKASGGVMSRETRQMGGLLGTAPKQQEGMLEEKEETLINQTMLGANQMPSLMGGRR
jgi:hypothetical protein